MILSNALPFRLWDKIAENLSEEEYEEKVLDHVRRAGRWYDKNEHLLLMEERELIGSYMAGLETNVTGLRDITLNHLAFTIGLADERIQSSK